MVRIAAVLLGLLASTRVIEPGRRARAASLDRDLEAAARSAAALRRALAAP